MSGEGLISVRFPQSLLELFRAHVMRTGRDLHDGARFIITHLSSISVIEWTSLQEPPQELDKPRVSIYVGRHCIDILTDISQKTQLPVSSIFRRLAYGLFVTRSLRFVQHSENKQWHLVHVKNGAENKSFQDKERNASAAS